MPIWGMIPRGSNKRYEGFGKTPIALDLRCSQSLYGRWRLEDLLGDALTQSGGFKVEPNSSGEYLGSGDSKTITTVDAKGYSFIS